MIDLHAIARKYGGIVTGGQAMIPAIGHSSKDRGVAIKSEASAPDGCLVHCFNGGDPLTEKDRLRADGFLPERKPKPAIGPWITVATFEYTDADGEVLYRTVRREPERWNGPGKRPKKFCAERCVEGRWISGIGDCMRVPYRLPELCEAVEAGTHVYLVEGEAKANKIAGMGLPATAIAFGANGWRAEYAQHLAGAVVYILPDNDVPGLEFANRVYKDLQGIAEPSIVELPGLLVAGDIIDWPGTADELAELAAVSRATDRLDSTEPSKLSGRAFHFVAVGDLQCRPPEFLVQDLVETETLGMVFGDPGYGKSFLAVDLGTCIATGEAFHGRPVKQGSVFFIAGEGHNGLARRFEAWSIARIVSRTGVPLFKSDRAAQMLDKESAPSVAEAVRELAAVHGPPALIIIDTLARNFGAGDENNTKDMSEFVAAIDKLKGQFPGCAVLIIHHSGHAEKGRARGAMALKAALDCEYRIEKKQNEVRMTCTKMKDASEPPDLFFSFRGVILGDATQSAVLRSMDAPERQQIIRKSQRLAIDTFIDAAAAHGRFETGKMPGLHLDNWQTEFLSRHTADNEESKKRAFRRVRNDLVTAEILSVRDDVYSTDNKDIVAAIEAKRTERT